MNPSTAPLLAPQPAPQPTAGSPPLLWGLAALQSIARPTTSWLWHGYLARGNVTLLTSGWKAGKTTLLSVLLHHLKTGGLVGGRTLEPGRALVISEESPDHWNERAKTLDFTDHVGWFCRPFRGLPRPSQWEALLERVQELHQQVGLDVVAVDPLAGFFSKGSESHAGSMFEALAPLQKLATAGPAVLVLHHPRRGTSPLGESARGTGSLLGFCDILMEMQLYRRRDPDDRRRKLYARSRFQETPRHMVLEWTPDGKDYACLGSVAEQKAAGFWAVLRPVFESAPHKLTRQELLQSWPGGRPGNERRLFVWLQDQVRAGVLRQDGTGGRDTPFRYWLPERENVWREDPTAILFMPELFEHALPVPAIQPARRRRSKA